MQETPVRFPGQEDPLEKGQATHSQHPWASLMTQMVKNPPAMWETWVGPLGWEDPLEEGMATYSSILDWRIPMDGGSRLLKKVRYIWATKPVPAQHNSLDPHKTTR